MINPVLFGLKVPVTVSVTHIKCFICRTNQDGDPVCDSDMNVLGGDLFEGPYFVLTDKSPAINLLFTALFDLIICSRTKRNLLIMVFPLLLKVATLKPYFPRRFPRSRLGVGTTSARNGLLAPRS